MTPTDTPPIRVASLRKTFGRFTAVDDVTFHVSAGEIFGYLGANGAGKSTTIKILCGLMRPSAGHAWVDGVEVGEASRAVRARIGYMSQKFSLYLDLPVRANLDFFAGAYQIPEPGRRICELAERLELTTLFRQRTGDLPGGIRQKVALACALLHRPPVVFLDEPTAGVDPASRREFWAVITELARAGTTVFVTTHYLDEAEGCDRVGLMVDGRLVALDTPAGLKRTHIPGRMFSVRTKQRVAVADALDKRPEIIEVQTFGSTLHVLSAPAHRPSEDSPPNLDTRPLPLGFAEEVRRLDPKAEIRPIRPSLEDVFLRVIQTYGRDT